VILDTLAFTTRDYSSTSPNKVLAIHEDGRVTCYSQDLGTEEWSTPIPSDSETTQNFHVEFANVLSVEVAKKAILKDREDVLASFDTERGQSDGSLLLMLVRAREKGETSASGALKFMILTISETSPIAEEHSSRSTQKLKLLGSTLIPEPSKLLLETSAITMHVASGIIYQNAKGFLAVYSLTGLVPRLEHELELDRDTDVSYLRLSTNLLACSSHAGLSVIELPYCSIQAQCSLTDIVSSLKPADREVSDAQIRLLSYCAPSDLAVALSGRKIIAIQLWTATLQNGVVRKRKREGLLINSIGRGSAINSKSLLNQTSNRKIKSLGTYMPTSSTKDKWDDHVVDLDRCALQGDAAGFETMAAPLLDMEIQEDNQLTFQSATHSRIDQCGIYHILSKIFSVDQSQHLGIDELMAISGTLKIRFLPSRICNLLIERGFMTLSNIEKSLKSSGALPTTSKLATGMLVRAFAEFDSSLELLSTLIASPVPLSSGELVHTLAIVTRGSSPSQSRESTNLVTNGEGESSDHDVQMLLTNGGTEQDQSSPPPIIDQENCSHPILTMAIKRLYAIPSSSISRALKTELSTPQLRTLVDALRMEIARSGWLSPYEDHLSAPPTDPPANDQISHIVHLLNSTIDSIGTGGWISGTSLSDSLADSDDTIAYMKAEISAALEGIEEATYLKGMLEEMLLCAKHSPIGLSKISGENQLDAVPAKPVTVPLEEVSNVLPLGLKPAQGVSTTKVVGGGELVRRSKRDIGRLKSKMVGKYSLERIVI